MPWAFASLPDRRLRVLRPHPLLRATVRLLRVRDVDGPLASDRPLSRGVSQPDPDGRRGWRAGGNFGLLRRWHTVAGASTSVGGGAACHPRRRGRRSHRRVQSRHRHPDLVAVYRDAGVTRLSFGVQSMAPHVLRALGRTHDVENVRRSVAIAREAGFEAFNIDLIYGAVGESVDDWSRTLDEVLELEPPHVSAYALTIEPGTPLASDCVAPSGRRRSSFEVRSRLRTIRRRWTPVVRDLELRSTGTRVQTQPPVLAARRLPRHRLRRAFASARASLVERAHARALHRCDQPRIIVRSGWRATR